MGRPEGPGLGKVKMIQDSQWTPKYEAEGPEERHPIRPQGEILLSFFWHIWAFDSLRLALSGSEGHLLNTHSVSRFENSDGQVFTEINHSCFSSMSLIVPLSVPRVRDPGAPAPHPFPGSL